tara:strand:- start:48424 stop:49878 length:1455 start_codon:yes stop_codon:yes gene_type:complete
MRPANQRVYIGLLLFSSSLEDIKAVAEAVVLIRQEYRDIRFTLFVHNGIIRNRLLKPGGHFKLSVINDLPKFKELRNTTVINLSPALGNVERSEFKTVAVYEKIFDLLRDNSIELIDDSNRSKAFETSKRIIWTSVYNPCDGYGSSAEQTLIALDRHTNYDIVFKPHIEKGLELAQPESKHIYNKSKMFSMQRGVALDGHYIYNAQPHEQSLSHLYRGKTINFTVWESNKIPPKWPILMNKFTEVWTASEWGRQIMLKCGVKRDIHVCSFGVNEKIFKYRKQEEPSGKFRFLIFANSHWEQHRKNYPAALEGFRKAFGNNKNVELVCKITTSGGNIPKLPNNVKLINERMTTSDLVKLIHSCHCFIFPSRGEGFGLPPREAMCCGVPVIVTNTSALQDIAKEKFTWPVQPHGYVPARGYSRVYGKTSELGVFDEVRSSDIAEQMLAVYNNYSDAIERSLVARKFISENQTYEHTAKRIIELLER